MQPAEIETWHMRRALELAQQGRGHVEPNPMVGCVIARGAEIVGEGWHRRFGGDHAEIEALRIAGPRAAGATLLVTLEPCCHQGKTPPCSRALVAAGIRRVVAAARDPFPRVDGGGLAELQAAGIDVEVGLLESEARQLNAPYFKLLATGRPWVLAKWAMSLDGKTATRSGASRWISGEDSRCVAHALRGRVDAILVGRETAHRDDPMLTARPPGPRTALRIVADSQASLPSSSQLVATAREIPVLVAVGSRAPATECGRLRQAGCEVLVCDADDHAGRAGQLLEELGRRRLTNILVEGGGRLAGSLADLGQIDEVHVFIAAKLIGGQSAPTPLAGEGIEQMAQALSVADGQWRQLGADLYFSGQIGR
jgi:diaminohydroxyphosphoribosylaminopyrimidine deaminase / 5-amino-6-(5-phosphoribosylamino)uracil reductase